MKKDLLYVVGKKDHNSKSLEEILRNHPEIKFVSLAGVDLVGHETEEKIPIQSFLDNIPDYLYGIAIQTDGSSVYLPNIATLDNAKIDMKADVERNWFVDYNFENFDEETKRPIGTLKIPSFLLHEGLPVCSRHTLLNAVNYFENEVGELISNNKQNDRIIPNADELDSIKITAATELEFWAKTPDDSRDSLELSTSQELHEQYWSSTRGAVRTALEQTLDLMSFYELEPEMGHKEVGGVKANLSGSGALTGIVEQLEIDWKYSDALQAADNELLAKRIIKEVFRMNGMDVTFLAKPIEGVAGSGEHTHLGIMAELKSGNKINLFNSNESSYLSRFGYGALMGILKNYEVINPFITSSNEAFKRLKKGFEAPICTVTSLGPSVDSPARNRSVLIGLIRDNDNPLATRFELRSPNPHTNTFLALTSMLQSMLDGIEYTMNGDKNEQELLFELSKEAGEETDYLEKDRQYRSEKDVFDDYTDKERENYFGFVPSTVFENIQSFDSYPEKRAVLLKGDVITKKLLESYKSASINKWVTEINYRIIPNLLVEIRHIQQQHQLNDSCELDQKNWNEILEIKNELAKDFLKRKSLFTQIREQIALQNFEEVSCLQKNIYAKMNELRVLYRSYQNNIID